MALHITALHLTVLSARLWNVGLTSPRPHSALRIHSTSTLLSKTQIYSNTYFGLECGVKYGLGCGIGVAKLQSALQSKN